MIRGLPAAAGLALEPDPVVSLAWHTSCFGSVALLKSNEGNRRDQQQGSEEGNAHLAPARIKCHMSVISLHLAKLCQAIFPTILMLKTVHSKPRRIRMALANRVLPPGITQTC